MNFVYDPSRLGRFGDGFFGAAASLPKGLKPRHSYIRCSSRSPRLHKGSIPPHTGTLQVAARRGRLGRTRLIGLLVSKMF